MQSLALELARGLTDRAADPLRASDSGATPILLALKRPGTLCDNEPPRAALDQLHKAAEITLVNLAFEQRRALWIERKWLGCIPRSPHVRERFEVYAAIAARDARAMHERASALLAGPPKGGDDWGRYLLITAILGGHVAGEHKDADRLWDRYGGVLYPGGDIPPYLLYVVNLR
jgi:hypothetical protein